MYGLCRMLVATVQGQFIEIQSDGNIEIGEHIFTSFVNYLGNNLSRIFRCVFIT